MVVFFCRCSFLLLLLLFPTSTPPVNLAHITLISATARSLWTLLLASEYPLFLVVSYMYTMQLYHIHFFLSSPRHLPTCPSPLYVFAFLLFCFNPLSPVIVACWNVSRSRWLDLVPVARAAVSAPAQWLGCVQKQHSQRTSPSSASHLRSSLSLANR